MVKKRKKIREKNIKKDVKYRKESKINQETETK